MTHTPLDDIPWIRYKFFERAVDARSPKGHAYIAEQMGVRPENLLTLRQIHGVKVVNAAQPWSEKPEGDALVATVPEKALGVYTADCVPILLASSKTKVVAAVHAGWKGAFADVCTQIVDAMQAQGAVKQDIVAVVGPCIHQKSYEVDSSFKMKFEGQSDDNSRFFAESQKDGHWMFDLPGYVVSRLGQCGIREVYDMGIDTLSNEDRYFSYRRASLRQKSNDGHQMSAIVIMP